MKILKKKFIMPILLFVIITGVLGACSDSFLDIKPQSALSVSSLGNKEGVTASLIGAYALLDGYHIDNNNTWPSDPVNWIMGSVPSDDAYKGSEQGDLGEITLFELYQWTPTNSLLDQKYRPLYEGVARSNNTINLVNTATGVDDQFKTGVLGEALFLRAYYHFELYKVFGAITVLNDQDALVGNFKKPNEATPDAALDLIIADAVAAVGNLPDTQTDLGRVTKKGANAFLGKLYIYKRDFASAEPILEAVVNSTALANCQRDLFTYATENAPEALFSVQMSLSNSDQARNSNWLNQLANPVGGGFGCCGFHQPSQNLVNAFKVDGAGLPLLDTFNDTDLDPVADNVDPRLDLTVGRDGAPYWDWAVHAPNFIRSRSYSGPYSPKKFQPYSTSPIVSGGWNGAANNGVNVPVIRLADVILLLAEAKVELNKLAEAEALVNKIRARAGNCAQGAFTVKGVGSAVITSDIHDAGITWANYDVQPYSGQFTGDAAYARKAVRFERRLELAMEGNRFFDLRRWDDMTPGYAATVLNKFVLDEKTKGKTGIDQISGARDSYYKDAQSFSATNRWYPFPFIEIQLSYDGGQPTLKQNPGYE